MKRLLITFTCLLFLLLEFVKATNWAQVTGKKYQNANTPKTQISKYQITTISKYRDINISEFQKLISQLSCMQNIKIFMLTYITFISYKSKK